METLSKLLCSARNIETEKGDLSGQCVFCGFDTTEGHEAKLKDTFTAYDLIQGGSCICPECWQNTAMRSQVIGNNTLNSFIFFNIYIPKSIYVMGTYTILY